MRKLTCLLIALLVVSPAFAALEITCSNNVYHVTVGYQGADPNLVRGFGLDISASDGAVISNVTTSNTDYYIYPGTIVIDAEGDVTDEGSPVAPEGSPGEKDPGITIEMASLYASNDPCGHTTAPATSGTLLEFDVDKDCTITISANGLRGGIVLEDGTTDSANLDVTLVITTVTECYDGMADYSVWEAVGKPDCWCYPRQCHGDADGIKYGSDRSGWYYVGTADILILAAAWEVMEAPFGPGISTVSYGGVPGACADFDHTRYGSDRSGWYHVGTADILILADSWEDLEPPFDTGVPDDCLPGNETP